MNFQPLKNRVDELTDRLLPCGDVRVWQDGRELFSYRTGCLNPENALPLTGEERFPGFSVTKTITCACALRYADRGLIRLDDRLSDYIPEFADMNVCDTDAAGKHIRKAKTAVTLRHLFIMTSGFSYEDGDLKGRTALECVLPLAERPLLFDPGTHWYYGLSHDILGAVLEKVSGKSLGEILKEELTAPLGMKSTCLLTDLRDCAELAPLFRAGKDGGYESAPSALLMPPARYVSGGAGIVTGASDYIRFLDALCTGRLLKAETLAEMTKNALGEAQKKDLFWPQLRGYGYGLGCRTLLEGAPSPSPAGEAGWGGMAGAYTLIDVKNRLSMCFFTNVLQADEVRIHFGLRDALYESL